MTINVTAQGIAAICAVLAMIGGIALYVIRAEINRAFSRNRKQDREYLERHFASKDEVRVIEARLDTVGIGRRAPAHGD